MAYHSRRLAATNNKWRYSGQPNPLEYLLRLLKRCGLGFGAVLIALMSFVLPAAAGVALVDASPATFSGPGETITFEYRLDGENAIVESMALTGGNRSVSNLSCSPDFPIGVFGSTSCTATYTTTASDVSDIQQYGQTYDLQTNGAPRGGSVVGTVTVAYGASANLVTVTWNVPEGESVGSVFAFTPSGSDQTNPGEEVTSPATFSNGTVHFFGPTPPSGYNWIATDNCGGSLGGSTWQLPSPLTVDCHVDFAFIPEDAPSIADTTTSVDANSAGSPVTLDIDGYEVTSVAVASQASNGIATASGTTITYTPDFDFVGTDSFTYTATNAAGTSTPATATISVVDPTLQDFSFETEFDTPLSFSVANDGVSMSYYYYLATAPDNGIVVLNADGSVTYAPDDGFAGTDQFQYDTGPHGKPGTVEITVAPPTITLSPSALSDAARGVSYSETISASGGTTPHIFAITSGTLPPGMVLSPSGTLSGTPTASGIYSFDITATDSSTGSGPFTASQSYSLTVTPGAPIAEAVNATVDYGSTSNAITPDFAVGGGTADTIAIAEQPDHGSATVSGNSILYTPTTGYAGPDSFSYTGTNAAGTSNAATVTVSVEDPDLTVTADGTLAAQAGSAYSRTFTFDGGAAPYTGADVTGLPDGLSVSDTTSDSVTISGTPTVDGTFSLTVSADDSSTGNGPFIARETFSLTVDAPDITVLPAQLPSMVGGDGIGSPVTAGGGAAPYSFAVTEGALPDGLTFDPDGSFSGVAEEAGSFAFTVTATDDNGFTGERAYTIAVDAPQLALDTDALADGIAGTGYGPEAITATGGTAPYSFSVLSGAWPDGLALAEDGTVSGTPTEAGSFTVTVEATDRHGFTGQGDVTVDIAAPEISLSPESLPDGIGGHDYGPLELTAQGGVAPYVFALSEGDLPQGLTITDEGIVGIPEEAGSFAVTLSATDDNGFSGTRDYTLVVDAPEISLSPGALPAGKVGDPYEATSLSAEGGTAPYAWSISEGALPAGLSLDPATGVLSGTPEGDGTFEVTVAATDAFGFEGTSSCSFVIDPLVPPEAQDHVLDLLAGTSATIDLTSGATGGPFLSADIASPAESTAGEAVIDGADGSYRLRFDAAADYSGTTALTYTLSNADGMSEPAFVTINVTARPDPSLDPEVVGLVRAQTEAAKRFARTQIDNFSSRLEQLHNEGDRRASSFGIRLGYEETDRDSSSRREIERFFLSPSGEGTGTGAMSAGYPGLAYGPEESGSAASATGFDATASEQSGVGSGSPAGLDLGRYAVWSSGFVNFAESDRGGMDIDATTVGVSGGIDYRFSDRFVAGLGIGYGRDKSDIGDNGTESRGHAYSAAIYGSFNPMENVYLDGLVGGSRLDFDSVRHITATGGRAEGSRDGSQLFGALTAAYEFREQRWLVSPYGRLDFSRSRLDAYSEDGGGIWSLSYGDQDIDTFSGVVGIRANRTFLMSWGALRPGLRAEYVHDFAGSSRATIGYTDIGTLPYAIDLAPERDDYATLGLTLDASFASGFDAGLEYRTSFGNDIQDHRLGVRVGKRF